LASAAVVGAGLASLPERTNWRQMAGAGIIAGVGFTVSLFISGLAFGGGGVGEEAKMGILAASVTAGLAGWLWLRLCCPGETGEALAADEQEAAITAN
jgi:NhaA family Na+:H+ antiporter